MPMCSSITALFTTLSSGGAAATQSFIANNSRKLGLQIASLARLTLVAGVSHTLYASNVSKQKNSGRHPFFAVLGGMLGLGSLAVGGAVLFDAFKTLGSANMLSEAVVGGIMMALFGTFAAYNSVTGMIANFKASAE